MERSPRRAGRPTDRSMRRSMGGRRSTSQIRVGILGITDRQYGTGISQWYPGIRYTVPVYNSCGDMYPGSCARAIHDTNYYSVQ